MAFCIDIIEIMDYNKHMKTYLFIINGLGVGDLPDCSNYNNRGYNTCENLIEDLPLVSFRLLGLYNVARLNTNESDTVMATFARGRMLTNKTGFADGITEILGNIRHHKDDETSTIVEDIKTRLNKSGVKTSEIGSGENFNVDYVAKTDDEVMNYISNLEEDKDGVIIAEYNDFANSLLLGDKDAAGKAIINIDNWLGLFMNYICDDDLLIVTGNHGVSCDDKFITREYVPIMMFTRRCPIARDLQTVQGLNVIAYTIAESMGVYKSEKAMMSTRISSSYTVDISIAKMKSILATSVVAGKRDAVKTLKKLRSGLSHISTKIDEKKTIVKTPKIKKLSIK